MISRRGIIGGLIGIVAAPAIVRFEALMPVKAIRLGRPWIDIVDHDGIIRTFYRDEPAANVEQWLQGRVGHCLKIYDQMGSGNHLVATLDTAPTVWPNVPHNDIGLYFGGR